MLEVLSVEEEGRQGDEEECKIETITKRRVGECTAGYGELPSGVGLLDMI